MMTNQKPETTGRNHESSAEIREVVRIPGAVRVSALVRGSLKTYILPNQRPMDGIREEVDLDGRTCSEEGIDVLVAAGRCHEMS